MLNPFLAILDQNLILVCGEIVPPTECLYRYDTYKYIHVDIFENTFKIFFWKFIVGGKFNFWYSASSESSAKDGEFMLGLYFGLSGIDKYD